MTISDYLAYGVTGEFGGDESTASLLGLWDVRRHAWWEAALDALEIPAAYLAAPSPTGDTIGAVSPEGASRLGLPPGIPFVAGGLDHYMAAIGAGLGTIAPAVDSTGTVLALCVTARSGILARAVARDRLATEAGTTKWPSATAELPSSSGTRAFTRPRTPCRNCSTRLPWFPPAQTGWSARPSADRYPGLAGFLHASPKHGHGHYIRALLESSAAELARLVATLFGGPTPAGIGAAGGGARSDLWMQIKADAIGTEFVVTACPEPACLGAALLSAVAAQWFDDVEAASAAWIVERQRFQPKDGFRRRLEPPADRQNVFMSRDAGRGS